MVDELLNLIDKFVLATGEPPERIVCGECAFQKIQQEVSERSLRNIQQDILQYAEGVAPNTVIAVKTAIVAKNPRGDVLGTYLINIDDLVEEKHETTIKCMFDGITLEVVNYQDEAENEKIYLLGERGFRMAGLQWIGTTYGYNEWTMDYDKVKEFLCNLNNVLPAEVSPVSIGNSNVAEISDDSLISILNGGDANDAG